VTFSGAEPSHPTTLDVDEDRDYKTKSTEHIEGSSSCLDKMLKEHVIGENLKVDFTYYSTYSNSDTTR
jgi:hypothetical protein